MSHIVTLGTEIVDLEALKAACGPLGLEFRENQKTHKAYFKGHCEHAIAVRGASDRCYEVGITKSASGKGYSLVADNWENGYGLIDKVGANAGLLHQEYALQVASKEIPRGFRMHRVVQENGHIQLRCSRS